MTHTQNLEFPKRQIKVLRTGAPSILLSYVLAAMLAAGAFLFIWLQGPGIWRDWQIQNDPVVVENATMRNAICKVRKGIFYNCTADVGYAVEKRRYQHTLDLSFVTFHSGDFSAEVVRSASNPELATLDIGLDMLWNRIAVMVLFSGLLLGAGVVLLLTGRKNSATRTLQGKLVMLSGIKATIKNERKVFGKTIINFSCHIDGKERDFASAFQKGEEPFYLDREEHEALAALPADGSVPFLLDGGVLRLELTEEERSSLRTRAT